MGGFLVAFLVLAFWFHSPGHGLRVVSERGSALVLPLTASQRMFRGRELEENARMSLHDDLLSQGYYTSRISIGTPPQEFSLIVDTGSTVTYVPCFTCTHCGHHQDPRFNPDNSSSYQVVSCRSPDCITRTCDGRGHHCRYDRMYAEMSSSKGILAKDLLGFGPDSHLSPQPLLFGCETAETGDLYLQHADGIMGLGRGALSIVDQLVEKGAIEDAFSLCYGGMDEGGGAMVLGALPTPAGMVFAKSDPGRSNYYNLELTEIQVQGVSLTLESGVFNGKFGTVLDSGTTYAYLPDRAFEAFRDAVIQHLGSLQAVDGPDANYPDICYAGAGSDIKELGKHFPTVDLMFAENIKVTLAPENYLFKHTKISGAYCLGFFKNQDATTLLGGIVVRNTLVTYDRYNHQIGFLKTNCTDLGSILLTETKPLVNVSSLSESPTTTPHPPDPPPSTQTPFPYAEREFGSIELWIQVAANLTTFSNQGPLFLSSMSTELGISQSQITIKDMEEEEGHAVVRCIISAGPLEHFSSSSARALAARFESHTVRLPALFGDYRLRSWKGVPPANSWGGVESKKVRVHAVVAVVVGLVVMLAGVASLAYWYFTKYWNRDQVKYNNLNQIEITEAQDHSTSIDNQRL